MGAWLTGDEVGCGDGDGVGSNEAEGGSDVGRSGPADGLVDVAVVAGVGTEVAMTGSDGDADGGGEGDGPGGDVGKVSEEGGRVVGVLGVGADGGGDGAETGDAVGDSAGGEVGEVSVEGGRVVGGTGGGGGEVAKVRSGGDLLLPSGLLLPSRRRFSKESNATMTILESGQPIRSQSGEITPCSTR